VASIIYGLLLLEEAKVAGKELIFSTMVVTVLMSTFAHGLTSIPFTKWYAKAFESLETESDVPELVSVPEMRVRSPLKSDHHTEVRKGSKH
jgi:NhaP-type Na+/H+ or K+/H+ antiporter